MFDLIILIILMGIIYFLYELYNKGFKLRRSGKTLPKQLVYALIGTVIMVPFIFHVGGNALNDMFHPAPSIKVAKHFKASDLTDTGTIHGTTSANITVRLKSMTETPNRKTTSDGNGKFHFDNLAIGDYAVQSTNGVNESKGVNITVGDNDTDTTNSKTSISGFTDDMQTYLNNKYPDVSFNYNDTDNQAIFTVSNKVASMSKAEQKNYIKPIYDRIHLFANANDMNEVPSLYVKTFNGSMIARSSLFHEFKVYSKK